MLRPLTELPSQEPHYDVCIIGAGPAGLALASRLNNGRTRICLLESGGRVVDPQAQKLNEAESVGLEYDSSGSRCRALGGTTHWWVGACTLPDPIDFEHRDWIAESSWPVPQEDFVDYFEPALQFLGLKEISSFEPERWHPATRSTGLSRFGFEPKVIGFSRPPINLGATWLSPVGASSTIECYENATVTEILSNPEGTRVDRVVVRSVEGIQKRIRADHFVICAGGLESARLLLLSDSVHPRGLGNDHDQVGRYFMEHLRFKTPLEPLVAARSIPPMINEVPIPGGVLKVGFTLSRQRQRAEEILNSNLLLFWSPLSVTEAELYHRIVPARKPPTPAAPPPGPNLAFLLRRPNVAGRFLWEKLSGRPSFRQMALCTNHEQSANPSSRVTLGEELDALGQRKLRIDWRLQDVDLQSIERFHSIVRDALEGTDFPGSRFDFSPPDGGRAFDDSSHPMGTTRMSIDPQQGVVDPDCRVHSIANLYVCGSSVFPRGGNANPTLLIVALALRLADHLKARLR